MMSEFPRRRTAVRLAHGPRRVAGPADPLPAYGLKSPLPPPLRLLIPAAAAAPPRHGGAPPRQAGVIRDLNVYCPAHPSRLPCCAKLALAPARALAAGVNGEFCVRGQTPLLPPRSDGVGVAVHALGRHGQDASGASCTSAERRMRAAADTRHGQDASGASCRRGEDLTLYHHRCARDPPGSTRRRNVPRRTPYRGGRSPAGPSPAAALANWPPGRNASAAAAAGLAERPRAGHGTGRFGGGLRQASLAPPPCRGDRGRCGRSLRP